MPLPASTPRHLFMCTFCFLLVVLLTQGIWAAEASSEDRPRRVTDTHDTDFVPSHTVTTPHVDWGRPTADALRMNILFTLWAPTARQVEELHQRLDFDYDYVGLGGNNMLWRGSSQNRLLGQTAAENNPEVARINMLLDKKHDVIVIGAVPWTWYPESVRNRILEHVHAGGGLVLTPHRQSESSAGGLAPLAELEQQATRSPGPFPQEGVRMVNYGQGRIAFVDIPWIQRYDDHLGGFVGLESRNLEPFARTLLWAAGRVPARPVQVDAQRALNQLTVIAAEESTTAITVYHDLERAYPQLYGTMPYTLRPYDSLELIEPLFVSQPDEAYEVRRMYALPAGPYVVLAQQKNRQGNITGWKRMEIMVPGAATISAIEVQTAQGPAAIDPATKKLVWLTPDDTAQLTVQTGQAPTGATMSLTLRDRADRQVASTRGPIRNNRFEAQLDLASAVHDLLVLTATLYNDEGLPVAEHRVPLLMNIPADLRAKHRTRTFGTALMRPELTRNAVSYFPGYEMDFFDSVIMHAWLDQQLDSFFGYSLFAKGNTNEQFHRSPSFHDEAYRAGQREMMRNGFTGTELPGSPGRAVLTVDEWAWGYVNQPGQGRQPDWPASINQDRSPEAVAAFREYLTCKYGSLAGLNDAWASAYPSWDQVEPYLFEGASDQPPPESAWPAIVDYQLFVQQVVADYLRELADVSTAINPLNRAGSSAFYSLGMLTGVDHALWARYAPHVIMYFDWHLWNSFVTEPMGQWFGYGGTLVDTMAERYRAWMFLIKEIEGVTWSREGAIFRPDHTPSPGAEAYYEELRAANDTGLSNLLYAAESVNDIGILYHPPSYMVHTLVDWQQRPGEWWNNVFRRKRYIDYLGRYIEESLMPWHYRFVSMEQLETGDFGRFARPRVLMLPLIEAISDQEAAVLRQFVESGGVLVGDLNTGMRLTSGRRRDTERGVLDDLFGIARRQHVENVAATMHGQDLKVPINFRSHSNTQGGVDFLWRMGHAYDGQFEVRFNNGEVTRTPIVGGPVQPAGAKALATLPDGQPAFLVHDVGDGKAIYLNYIPWDNGTYDRIRAEAGIPLDRHKLDEGDERIVEAIREYQLGDQLYLAALTRLRGFSHYQHTPAEQAHRLALADKVNWISLPAPAHLYDARRGVYLGYTDTAELRFDPDWVANVYAALPYKVENLAVQASVQTSDGRSEIHYAVAVKVDQGQPQTHVLSLTFTHADGQTVSQYTRQVAAVDGMAQGTIVLAENDPAGPWTLRVRDAATGVSSEITTR